MVKVKTAFVCQNCGFGSAKWMGRCPDCSEWNTLVQEEPVAVTRSAPEAPALEAKPLSEIASLKEDRVCVGIDELDRVLGGGLVRGSVVLIGGDPGIGKSTIALQISDHVSQKGKKVLYVSGEESLSQTKLRASRIGADGSQPLFIINATDFDSIIASIKKFLPDLVIIDSIQVVHTSLVSSSPGSVGQVRECAHILTQLAKHAGITVLLIGHVNKEGNLAGPKVLEHVVDTVLYFEGERFSSFRVLRAFKNRFGSTNEIGVFEMVSSGLRQVLNPSELFLAERPEHVSGSVVVPLVEGSRPLLIEVQALVAGASYGVIRRKAQGVDYNRLNLLSAVLEKRLDMKLFDKDIFVNVVGGIKVDDPAIDLGVCLAICSAFKNKAICDQTVVLGEVGLSSEVRSVTNIAARINEAKKLGFKRCILPYANYKSLGSIESSDFEFIPVRDLKSAYTHLLEK